VCVLFDFLVIFLCRRDELPVGCYWCLAFGVAAGENENNLQLMLGLLFSSSPVWAPLIKPVKRFVSFRFFFIFVSFFVIFFFWFAANCQ